LLTVAVNPDGPLVLARRRLDDAVRALADPTPEWDHGVCRWADPLYVRLRTALRGQASNRTGARRSAPCRIDVLTLLIEVDVTVAGWEPHAKGTIDRLRALAGHRWRPQNCALLEDYCGQLQRWVLVGTELLDRRPVVHLHVPCPSCGARWAYRDNSGERVRVRALRVSETGCECLACRSFWGTERFEWLARLLGCSALPAG
jgi:hypothetical protein